MATEVIQHTNEWQAAFNSVAEDRQRELKARRKMIKDYDCVPEIQHIKDRMKRFRKSFSDMITPENKFSYNDIIINFLDPGSYGERTAGQYQCTAGVECLYIKREMLDDNPTLLHEMLHLHENHMTGEERAQFYAVILGKVKRKVADLDLLLGEKDAVQLNFFGEGQPDPLSHDNLFFVKSVDLDLRKGYPLGTVFGYGMPEVIKYIRDTLETPGGYSEIQISQWELLPVRRGPFGYKVASGPKEKRG